MEEKLCPFVLLSALTDKRAAHGRIAPREEHGFAVQKSFHRRYGDRLRDFIFAWGKPNRTTVIFANLRTIRKDFAGYLTNLCLGCSLRLAELGRWALALEVIEPHRISSDRPRRRLDAGKVFANVFGNVFGRFWCITADRGPPGPQKSILEHLTPLVTSHESSGAHLGLYF